MDPKALAVWILAVPALLVKQRMALLRCHPSRFRSVLRAGIVGGESSSRRSCVAVGASHGKPHAVSDLGSFMLLFVLLRR